MIRLLPGWIEGRCRSCALLLATVLCGCGASDAGGAPAAAQMSCATAATPDVTFGDIFTVDTGFSGSSAPYGQVSCPGQYLVEVDLSQPPLQARSLFVSGHWSTTLPVQPCDEQATMTVFAFDGSAWQVRDVVGYRGVAEGSICHAQPLSHTDRASAGLGGTSIPSGQGLVTLRVAVAATEGELEVPVFVAGD